MAVHTEVDWGEVEAFLVPYDLGPLEALEGVPEGSIHTTYRLRTARGTAYLRLTEGLGEGDVAFELALLEHLAGTGTAAPRPLRRGRGRALGRLAGRIAVVFSEVRGAPVPAAGIAPAHAAAVGAALGGLHRDTEAFPHRRPNPYRPEIIAGWLDALDRDPPPDPAIRAAIPSLARALAESRSAHPDAPGDGDGVVHADLFPDNVHFEGGRLAGLLDFEMACTAPRGLDVAIGVLVWGFAGGAAVPERIRALADAYGAVRPLPPTGTLFDLCRFAAVRYTVTRIRDFALSSLSAERLVRKDWQEMHRRLSALEALGEGGLGALAGNRTSGP